MIQYTPTPDYYRDYVQHGIKDWVKKNHKYISRERGKNGKWKYTYKKKIKKIGDKIHQITNKIDKDHDYILDIFDRRINVKNSKSTTPNSQRNKEQNNSEQDNKQSKKIKQVEAKQKKVYKYFKKIKLASGKWRYFYSQLEYNRYVNRKNVLDKDYEFMQDVPTLSRKLTPNEVLNTVDVGTKKGNCSSCTMSLELLMRGYAVQSKSDIDGATTEEISSAFKDLNVTADDNWYVDTSLPENKKYYHKDRLGFKKTSEEEKLQIAQDDLERQIKTRGGDNQRGFIEVGWTQTDPDENGNRRQAGGGHIFNYVVENGKVRYYDMQKGSSNGDKGKELDIKTYLDNTDYLTHQSIGEGKYATYCRFYRVDDKELSSNSKSFINYTPIEVHDTPEEKTISTSSRLVLEENDDEVKKRK